MGNSKLDLLFSNPSEFLRRGIDRVRDQVLILVSPSARRHAEVGPAFGWKATRDVQLEYLKGKLMRPEHSLLDLGCGTLRGGVPIIRYLQDGHYVGIEARAEVLKTAEQELQDEKLEHKKAELIHSADLSTVEAGRKFDFIWAHSVLIHMTDEILEDCLTCVAAHLDRSGGFYANVNLGDTADNTWKEFPIVFRAFQFYSEAAARHGLSCEEIGPWRSGEHAMLLFQLVSRSGNDMN